MASIQEPKADDERDFIVVFTVKPGTRLPGDGEVQLNFPEDTGRVTTVILKNLLEFDPSGTSIPIGLKLDVKVRANNIDEAIKKAGEVADGVVSFASICTGVGLPVVKVELAYDITPGTSDRDFLQFFRDVPLKPSRRTLEPATMIDLMDRVFKVADVNTRNRLSRAIRWYRKGSLATDVFEKFACYWTGLEALNPLLQAKFGISDDSSRCPYCKKEWISTPTVSGIRTAVQNLIAKGSEFYTRIKELRVGLIHSKSDLKMLLPEAEDLEPIVREALVRSIFFILGVSPTETILRDTLSAEVPIVAALEATIHGSDPSNLGPPSEHPHFELRSNVIQKAESSKDKVSLTVTTSRITRVAQGVTITCYGWRLYGQEATVDKLEVK